MVLRTIASRDHRASIISPHFCAATRSGCYSDTSVELGSGLFSYVHRREAAGQ